MAVIHAGSEGSRGESAGGGVGVEEEEGVVETKREEGEVDEFEEKLEGAIAGLVLALVG